jgi:hypothetical protein
MKLIAGIMIVVLGFAGLNFANGDKCECEDPKEWSRTWYVHNNVTATDGTIDGWHTLSTDRICKVDGTGDIAAAAEITRSGDVTRNWTYPGGGNQNIQDMDELLACLGAMEKNSAVLNTMRLGSPGARQGER